MCLLKFLWLPKLILKRQSSRQKMFEKEMAEMPSWLRSEILLHIVQLLREEKNTLAEVLCKEACKPLKLASAEVERAIQTFIVAAEEAKRLPKEYISIDWTPARNIEKKAL